MNDQSKKYAGVNLSRCRALSSLFLVAATVVTQPSAAQETFDKQFYLGLGVGSTGFEPELADGSLIELEDDEHNQGAAVLGRDFSDRWTAELQLMRSGGTVPDGGAELNYQALSLMGHYYVWNSHASRTRNGHGNRNGFSAFGRAGVGQIKSKSEFNFDGSSEAFPVAGAGVEYGFDNGLALRADYMYYDATLDSFSIWALYRMGRAEATSTVFTDTNVATSGVGGSQNASGVSAPVQGSGAKPFFPAVKGPEREPEPELDDGIRSIALYPKYTDELDCSRIDAAVVVANASCSWRQALFTPIEFLDNAVLLSQQDETQLASLAVEMKRNPAVKLVIKGHSQSLEESQSRLRLSRDRVLLVARFLLLNGMPGSQIIIRANGG